MNNVSMAEKATFETLNPEVYNAAKKNKFGHISSIS